MLEQLMYTSSLAPILLFARSRAAGDDVAHHWASQFYRFDDYLHVCIPFPAYFFGARLIPTLIK
jgi:hypothetical protein